MIVIMYSIVLLLLDTIVICYELDTWWLNIMVSMFIKPIMYIDKPIHGYHWLLCINSK